MGKAAAVVVTYNRKYKLANCISAVLAQTAESRPDIIIVDNGSSDGTEELLRSRFGDHIIEDGYDAEVNEAAEGAALKNADNVTSIRYYNLRFNSGGAGGFCFGMRKAAELAYDYLWILDDDSVPSETALEAFLSFDRAHWGEYGFLSGKILWKDGSLCLMNVQRETVTRNVRSWDRSVIPVEMASFVSLFVPMPVVLEAGLPLSQFYIWTEDWEYTRRISLKHPCYLITDSVTVHDMDVNGKADICKASADRLDRFRYLYRNDVYLYRREGLRGFCYESARLAWHSVRIAACGRPAKEKLRCLKIMAAGTIRGLSFHPVPDRIYINQTKGR